MSKENIRQNDNLDQDNTSENITAHQEAVDFVKKNRDFYEHYARGGVQFEAAPPDLGTFGCDLLADPPKIYLNSRFYKKRGLSDQKTSFATLHEVEHLLEKKQLLSEKGGDKIFQKYIEKLKASEAFNFLDNRVADLRENRAVVSKTNPEFDALRRTLYREDLVPGKDFTAEPRHIQFVEAISREGEVPDEQCVVSPEVRVKLDEIKAITGKDGRCLMDAIADPVTSMSDRLVLEDKFLWPAVQELLKQDKEDYKNNQDKKGEGKEGGEAPREGQEDGQQGGQESADKEKKEGKGRRGKKKKSKKEEPGRGESRQEGGDKPLDPNEIFKEAYERAAERVPNAVPIEEMEKAFQSWKEKRGESPADRADREYAEKLGVKPEDLRRYRDIVQSLEKITNPETGESAVEELRNLFARIIARRLKLAPAPRYPVEEGEELVNPAEAIAEVKAGNLEPKVWETYEIKEIKGKRFGEVEITLVCDRSSSMTEGTKLPEQRRAAVLVMEALKEFAEQCDEERVNMNKPLEIRSEIYSFKQSSADSIPLKKMSKELGEKERIDVMAAISSAPGGTTDFVPLETVEKGMSEETRQKITEGELKKIMIVFTDGKSNDPSRVRNILEKLRSAGVVTIGVGITEEGKAALTTYAPDARLAEKAEDLTRILTDLLKEHLADI